MQPALVLFDVDGTLLLTQGATSRCILRACKRMFGDQFEWADITVGTLDQQIFGDLCRANGVDNAEAHLDEYKQVYLQILQDELERTREDIIVLPGVRELLAQLDEMPHVASGIVSGNFRRAVDLKLEYANIENVRFEVKACAEDGASRIELPRVAMCGYESQTGNAILPDRVFIIGDTPRDIECARACDAKVICTATGRYDEAALADGDLVMTNLTDLKRILRFIEGR